MEALLKEPKFFVRQYYARGQNRHGDIPFLYTYYYKDNEIDVNRANLHLKQLRHDKFRFLYDTDNEEHRKKLLVAAQQPAGYKIFINLLPQRWQPTPHLRRKIHAYMRKVFHWEPHHLTQKLSIRLQDLYGNLYLLLSWKDNKAEVILDEVESTDPYVL